MSTASTMPAPCMTIKGRPVYEAPLVTIEAYDAEWSKRDRNRQIRSQIYNLARYVSVYVETDCGVEIEVSALVDLRFGGKVDIDDVRCRLVGAAEVELAAETIRDETDNLWHAAIDLARSGR